MLRLFWGFLFYFISFYFDIYLFLFLFILFFTALGGVTKWEGLGNGEQRRVKKR